jgi:hypothetical protein
MRLGDEFTEQDAIELSIYENELAPMIQHLLPPRAQERLQRYLQGGRYTRFVQTIIEWLRVVYTNMAAHEFEVLRSGDLHAITQLREQVYARCPAPKWLRVSLRRAVPLRKQRTRASQSKRGQADVLTPKGGDGDT